MQTVSSGRLKFKTFGDSELGSTTGTSGNPSLAAVSGPGGSPNSGPGSLSERLANCTTLSCKLNETRVDNSGHGAVDTSTGPSLTTILSNYTETDEDKTRTDVTVTTNYQQRVTSVLGTDVYFVRNGAFLKVQADAVNFVSIKFRKLADSDGQRAVNFNLVSWTWSSATKITGAAGSYLEWLAITCYGTVTVQTVKGTFVNVYVYVNVWSAFNASGSLTYGNGTLPVDPTSVKITYEIQGWPFCTTRSFLYLGVTLNSNKNGIVATGTGLTIGGATVSIPSLVFVDYQPAWVDVFFSKDSDDVFGCQGKLLMVFPHFHTKVFYVSAGTPTTAPTSSRKGALGSSSFSLVTALLAVLLMLALNQF
jgi:hypothetical protein